MDKRHHRTAVHAAIPPSLSGPDLVEFVAHNTSLQKQRWMDVYKRLWERRAKVDIVDTLLIEDGIVSDWFFTSSTTGVHSLYQQELQRKPDASVTPVAIKRHFVRSSDPHDLSRQMARLIFQLAGGISYTVLTDLEFNLVLCQPSSALWQSGFILQPLIIWPRNHEAFRGTFVAKYSALIGTACTRVLHMTSGGLYELSPTCSTGNGNTGSPDNQTISAHGARMQRARAASSEIGRGVDEIVRTELRKLVLELERGFRDSLRLLTAEFQITATQRLVLVRASSIVFASDLKQPQRLGKHQDFAAAAKIGRPQSAPASRKSSAASNTKCAGRAFCECRGVATTLSATLPLTRELQQITRRSISLSEEESEYLARFGAEAEAKLVIGLASAHLSCSRDGAVPVDEGTTSRLLQRRLFMLRNTLWNPKSDAFNPKIMEFQDAQRLPQQYEMVTVCRTCYLIYHSIDSERFQVAQATTKEAVERTLAIYSSQLVASEQAALSLSPGRPRRMARINIPTVSSSSTNLAWASPLLSSGSKNGLRKKHRYPSA